MLLHLSTYLSTCKICDEYSIYNIYTRFLCASNGNVQHVSHVRENLSVQLRLPSVREVR